MENLIKLLFILLLFSSCEEPKEVYDTEIKTYVISQMYEESYGRSTAYYVYFQTPTSTEMASVSYDTYKSMHVGDTIKVLIKYWQKPKRK